MNTHPLHSFFGIHCAALLMALACSGAQAQSYTVKELSKPFLAVNCYVQFAKTSAAVLNNAGDVAGMCSYAKFSLTAPANPAAVGKPVVWRAGGNPTVLNPPTRTRFNPTSLGLGVNNQGDILGGSASPLNWLGLPSGKDDAVPVILRTTKSTLLPLPTNLSGRWDVIGISHGGTLLLYGPSVWDAATQTNSSPQGYAVWSNGQAVRLPEIPVPQGLVALFAGHPVINDQGQVAMGYRLFETRPNDPYTLGGQVGAAGWLWTGNAWKPMVLPQGTTLKWIDAINNLGQVSGAITAPPSSPDADERVEKVKGIRFVWQEQQGTKISTGSPAYLQQGTSAAVAMNDQGQIVGSMLIQRDQVNYSTNAAIWQPGQLSATNLNTLATLPKGVVLNEAYAINERGQILAGTGLASPRLFLLTPR